MSDPKGLCLNVSVVLRLPDEEQEQLSASVTIRHPDIKCGLTVDVTDEFRKSEKLRATAERVTEEAFACLAGFLHPECSYRIMGVVTADALEQIHQRG